MALTFRDIKGSPLTSAEADANIRTLGASALDYTAPISVSGPLTLAVNKTYYVTGTGYTLTLPAASSSPGAAIFITIATNATGLFPLAGSNYTLYAMESLLLRSTANGWQKTGGELLAMDVRLETSLTQQDTIVTGAYYTVPLSQTIRTVAATPGIISGSSIIVQRGGLAIVRGGITLSGCDPAGNFFYGVAVLRAGSVVRVAQITGAISGGRISQEIIIVEPTRYQPGDQITLYTYVENVAAAPKLRGQFAGSQCLLTYIEIV